MDYCSDDGRNFIEEWYRSKDATVQAEFDMVLYILAATKDWSARKEFKILTGKHIGLCELKVKANKVQYRPVGICDEQSSKLILLLGCEKSGRIYRPRNAFDMALELKRMFDQGLGSLNERIV